MKDLINQQSITRFSMSVEEFYTKQKSFRVPFLQNTP